MHPTRLSAGNNGLENIVDVKIAITLDVGLVTIVVRNAHSARPLDTIRPIVDYVWPCPKDNDSIRTPRQDEQRYWKEDKMSHCALWLRSETYFGSRTHKVWQLLNRPPLADHDTSVLTRTALQAVTYVDENTAC